MGHGQIQSAVIIEISKSTALNFKVDAQFFINALEFSAASQIAPKPLVEYKHIYIAIAVVVPKSYSAVVARRCP